MLPQVVARERVGAGALGAGGTALGEGAKVVKRAGRAAVEQASVEKVLAGT